MTENTKQSTLHFSLLHSNPINQLTKKNSLEENLANCELQANGLEKIFLVLTLHPYKMNFYVYT